MPDGPLLICPIYIQDSFAAECLRRCVDSWCEHTPDPQAILLLDDASPLELPWLSSLGGRADLVYIRFGERGGLTRSWNAGLRLARERGWTWAVAGNSDVIFSPGWWAPLRSAIERGWHLVGPVTNAPGKTRNGGLQNVRRYFAGYVLSDEPRWIEETAKFLRERYSGQVLESGLNGFCLAAETERWWAGAWSDQEVFDPGRIMEGNEDELQKRWRGRGWKIGICPDSFVFHYRSVSRGPQHLSAGFFRPDHWWKSEGLGA